MEQYNAKSGFYSAVLFLVWPFLALISAFRNYKSGWAKNILWAFIAFYGFSFAIGSENGNADIVRYVAEYQNLHKVEMTVASALNYFHQSGEVDVARTFIAIVLSRFTGNQAVLTLVYGIIFGFFFSRNMWFVLEHLEGRIKPIVIFLFLCFFLVIPFWNLNGFRFWTAAHIFIYGLLPFLFEGKKRGAIVSATAILFHFTFLVPVAVLFVYMFLGNRMVIYFIFFLTTFFISQVNITVFNDVVESYAPKIIQERTASYRKENYVENVRKSSDEDDVWYANWYQEALKWSVMGFLVLIFIRGRVFFTTHKMWLRLFSFTLLFYGVANIFSSLPSGARFVNIANTFALVLIILYLQNKEDETIMRPILLTAAPFLLLFIVVSVRMGLYSVSATTVLGNPVISLFFNEGHISLNDVMKMIL